MNKNFVSTVGTQYEGFHSDWAWRRIRELWPKEIIPTTVIQKDSIRNEWTTYMKVNY